MQVAECSAGRGVGQVSRAFSGDRKLRQLFNVLQEEVLDIFQSVFFKVDSCSLKQLLFVLLG
ncbi:hypothetical protein [Pseudomonas sp. 5P_5.1_Bac1]|uniref:hypothetical protein n=1 Tax=Pseudomonas sp. 5P_5.1_Bac1 TaxID=2971616 RepID=UPI0021CA626B|nr:hypothetical protein [Pseudomonas sp. 5P_5.1_Bac1]MCU1722260.1 hypothetical protein [Pseudomonas sp. 5P_5.1_Bac1]